MPERRALPLRWSENCTVGFADELAVHAPPAWERNPVSSGSGATWYNTVTNRPDAFISKRYLIDPPQRLSRRTILSGFRTNQRVGLRHKDCRRHTLVTHIADDDCQRVHCPSTE